MTDPTACLSGHGVRSILRNGAYLLGSQWLAVLLRFVYVVVLARALSPAGYGLISSTQALYLMVVVLLLQGFPDYLSRERASGRDGAETAVRSGFLLAAVALSIGAVGFLTLGIMTEHDRETRLVFLLFSVAILARGLAWYAAHTFVAFEASQHQLKLVAIFRTGELIVAIFALFLGAGLVVVAVVHLVSWLLEAIAGVGTIHRQFVRLRIRHGQWHNFWPTACSILAVSAAVGAASLLRLSPVALVRYVSDTATSVGHFAFAWNASLILSMSAVAVMRAAFPVVSRARARGDDKDKIYIDFCVRYGVLSGVALVMAGMCFGEDVVVIATGTDYRAAGSLFSLALGMVGPVMMNHALDQTLYLHQRTRLIFALNGGGVILVITSFASVFHRFGAETTILAVSGMMVLLVVVKTIVVHFLFGLRLWKSFFRAVVASIPAVVATILLIEVSSWIALFCGLLVLCFAALVSKTVNQVERRAVVSAIVSRVRGVEHG